MFFSVKTHCLNNSSNYHDNCYFLTVTRCQYSSFSLGKNRDDHVVRKLGVRKQVQSHKFWSWLMELLIVSKEKKRKRKENKFRILRYDWVISRVCAWSLNISRISLKSFWRKKKKEKESLLTSVLCLSSVFAYCVLYFPEFPTDLLHGNHNSWLKQKNRKWRWTKHS